MTTPEPKQETVTVVFPRNEIDDLIEFLENARLDMVERNRRTHTTFSPFEHGVMNARNTVMNARENAATRKESAQKRVPKQLRGDAKKVVLEFIQIVRVEQNARSFADKRRRTNKYICEYRDPQNVEYRVAFERKSLKFQPPTSGTLVDLNRMKYEDFN